MRRLTILIGSTILAAWAARLLFDGSISYMLRDGLLVAIIAALLFALHADPPRNLKPGGVTYHWPLLGRALWGAGLLSMLAAALLAFAKNGAFIDALRVGLWLIGLAAMWVGAFRRGTVRDFSPPSYRWQRDADDEFERVLVEPSTPVQTDSTGYLSGTAVVIGLIVLLGVGAYLRLRSLGSMPQTCLGDECGMALILIASADIAVTVPRFYPFIAIAKGMLHFLAEPVISLRLTSASCGIGALLFLFLGLRRLIIPESALIGTGLLALSGWHIAVSRTGLPASMALFAMTVSLWAMLHALTSRDRRWWATTGLAFGFLGLTEPALIPGIWLWAVLVSAIGSYQQRRLVRTTLLLPVSAIALSLPTWIERTSVFVGLGGAAANVSLHVDKWLQAANDQPEMSILTWLTAALAILGIGYMLRFVTRSAIAAILAGLGSLALSFVFKGQSAQAPLWAAIAPLLSVAFFAAALAVDQLLRCTVETWRVLVRPAYWVAATLLLVALLGVRSLGSLQTSLAAEDALASNVETAMTAYLSEQLDAETTVFVPPKLITSPQFQLQDADWLDNGQVLPLTSIREALFSGDLAATQRFLVSGVDRALLDLLSAYFPNSTVEPHFDDMVGQLLFHVFTVAPEDRVWPGLTGVYVNAPPRSDTASSGAGSTEFLWQRRDGPLSFDWPQQTAFEHPFVATWQGSLSVPAAGDYTFTVDGVDSEKDDFTLFLDNQIVLATSLGLSEKRQVLAEGIYRLDMRFASDGNPANLSVQWQRPDGVTEVLQKKTLASRLLPNLGLTGAYFSGADFQSPPFTVRKDVRFDPRPDLEHPYSVRWTGKLAANRAGEYLLATVGDGDSRLSIDGHLLVDNSKVADDDGMGGYVEGLIYLEEGWHELSIDYVPEKPESALQMLWQPPGSFATALSSVYLTPVQGEVGPDDLSLPTAPALIDPRLGGEDFALTQGVELRQAKVVRPPADLPSMALAPLWQTDAICGDADDQLNWPHGVAIDGESGRLFVVDSGNRRLVVYDLDGNRIRHIESQYFEEPHDIDISPDGQVYVLDAVGSPLLRVDANDGSVEPIPLDTGFYRPRGLAVAPAGVIAVADTGGGRVVLLTRDGVTLAQYGGAESALGRGQPVDVALTGRALWSVTAEDGRLWDLNTDGSMIAVARTTTLDGPQIATLADGTFYLSDPERRILFHHRADGKPMGQFAFDGILDRPTGIDAALIDGQVHLAVIDTARCTVSLWRTPF